MRLAVNGRFIAARPTGVQRVARELVRRLPSSVDVTLHVPRGAAADGWPDTFRPRPGVLGGPLWEHVELPLRRARNGYDVALDPANAGPRLGIGRVMVLHDVFPLTNPAWYGRAFRWWFASAVAPSARRADRVVMFTRWARDRAVDALGLDPARVRLVGQGVEPFDEPLPAAVVHRTRERLGLPHRFILATGGGDPRKNVEFLVPLLDRLDGLSLVVVGEGYRHVHASGDGAPASVRRLGHVSDLQLRALYRAATVFCFPSLGEGFGRPPLEALASGTPAVVAGYGCAAEVLGDAAARVALDPEAWIEAIGELAEEGPVRRGAIAAGLRRAAEHRWADAADALARVCRDVAGERRGGSA